VAEPNKGSRRRKGGGGGGGGGGRSRGRSGGGQQQGGGGRRRPPAIDAPKKGKAHSTPYTVPAEGAIAPFDLFCACYLGLMPDGTFRASALGEVARRLGRGQNEIRQMLADYKMDTESLKEVDFDVSLGKLDMQVAPEGIDRRELARGLYDEFLEYHDALADIDRRYQAGEVVTTAAPSPADAPSGDDAAPSGRGRGRGRSRRGTRSQDDPGTTGSTDSPSDQPATPVAVTDGPQPADDSDLVSEADLDEADAALEAELIADDADLVTADVGSGDAKSSRGNASRHVRRSPTRRGS